MRKLLPFIFLFCINAAKSQGLENVIVETYYISDANDTTVNDVGGVLPVGSVTYRIYADMLPGYKFQAVYGIPGHELRIETSTLFFNNEDRGATFPTYTKNQAKGNTVMLDSWLSVGGGCSGNYGILKANDDGVATVVNNDNVLMNATLPIPLTTQDGLIAGTPEAVTAVGLTAELAMLDNQNDGTNGPLISTFNGSWASLNGSVGPDTVANQVLIAQITTDGVFAFKLNIQIGTPAGGSENYVAENPVGNEIQSDSLIYPHPVSVNSISAAPQFLLYPNPASGLLKIKLFNKQAKSAGYTVRNINGAAVINNNIGADLFSVADVSGLAPGLYILEVNVDGVKSASKFVKE
jgi:hypothetical protein